MKRVLRWIPPIIFMGASALGVMNVYGDSKPVEALARATACAGEGPKCVAQQNGGFAKNAFFQSYALRTGPRRTVEIRCARAYYLLGDYACKITAP